MTPELPADPRRRADPGMDGAGWTVPGPRLPRQHAAHHAQLLGRPDDAELRRQLRARLEAVNGPRCERYLTLLTADQRLAGPRRPGPVLDWSTQAL